MQHRLGVSGYVLRRWGWVAVLTSVIGEPCLPSRSKRK